MQVVNVRADSFAKKYIARNTTWLSEVDKNIDIIQKIVDRLPERINYKLIDIPPEYHGHSDPDVPTKQYIGLKIHQIEPPIYEWNLLGYSQSINMPWDEFEQMYNLQALRQETERKYLKYMKLVQLIEPPPLGFNKNGDPVRYYWAEYL